MQHKCLYPVGSLIFVATCLPETRGRSLEEMEKYLEKKLTPGVKA